MQFQAYDALILYYGYRENLPGVSIAERYPDVRILTSETGIEAWSYGPDRDWDGGKDLSDQQIADYIHDGIVPDGDILNKRGPDP